MIVEQIGYLKYEQLIDSINKGDHFSIYRTKKDTLILIKGTKQDSIHLYYPKRDRLPYKTVEGKKITEGIKIYDSDSKLLDEEIIGNQIMAYQEFYIL